ncbi:MAG: sensor histidine kinase [Alphaproteobacteria bacterium]
MPRTLFGKIFLWSSLAQLITLGSMIALVTFYLPDSEEAINNAWSLYAHTAVVLLEKFGPAALDQFLTRTGEDTLLQLQLEATRPGVPCTPAAAAGSAATGASQAPDDATTAIATRGLEGDYCLTVHANAGGLPQSPESHRSRLQIAILFELLSCAGLSYFVARYLARPISELRSAVTRLARGDLTARVGGKFAARNDEAADLVREFDHMAERVADLIVAQRRLIGDISHEIKSPLARLAVALGLARRAAEEHAPKQFDRMQREIGKISQLVSELLTLAWLERDDACAKTAAIDIAAVVERIVADAVYESQGRVNDVVLKRPERPIIVEGDENLLRQAIENVVRNAIFYTSDGTKVEVSLALQESGWVRLEIRDHGPGVPASALAHLFEPFYRVDEARARQTGGSGVGLAICARAKRLLDGFVRARNGEPRGLVVEIGVPLGHAA